MIDNPDVSMIEVYHNTITPIQSECIINAFKNDGRKYKGKLGKGEVDNELKISTDLNIHFNDAEYANPYHEILHPALVKCVDKYVDKYFFMKDYYPFNFNNGYNIQYYGEGEGYSALHCEHRPDHDPIFMDRMMAWMVYLNDAECGTHFPHQLKTTQAVLGDCVLWPAYWTHPHKGVTPNIGDKYIATGWLAFVPQDFHDK